MKKIKIIAICCIAYMGIGLAALHTPDAQLSATNYTNYYYRFYEKRLRLTAEGTLEWHFVATNTVYGVTAPNTTSCLNGYYTPTLGEWRYQKTVIEPYAFACLP